MPQWALQPVQCPQTLDSSKEKIPFSGGKTWKKPQEEPRRTDRRATDAACTEQINKSTEFTG